MDPLFIVITGSIVTTIVLYIKLVKLSESWEEQQGLLTIEIRNCRNQIEHLMNQDDGIALAWDLNYRDKIHTYEYRNARIEFRQKVGEPGMQFTSQVLHMSLHEAQNKFNELLAKQHDDCMNLSDEERKMIQDRRESEWDEEHVLLKKSEVAAMKRKRNVK